VWGGIGGLGSVVGLVAAGALTDLLSWRLVFGLNLPLALLAIAFIPLLVVENHGRRSPLDVPGALLVTGGLVAIVAGLLGGPTGRGRTPPSHPWSREHSCLLASSPSSCVRPTRSSRPASWPTVIGPPPTSQPRR
jgi:MFS family permease